MNPAEPDRAEPEQPADLEPLVRRIAASDPDATHPAAAVLTRFDEEPLSLSPRTREWIAAHLVDCPACRNALAAVPRLALAGRPLRPRLLPIAAAAGWILAAFLAFEGRTREPEGREPFLSVHSLVLSTPRGGEAPSIPAGARILRCELVLGEEIALGALLQVRVEDATGRTLIDAPLRVEQQNEREWPVLTLDRAALPRGPVRLHVRSPSGLESVFELSL
jgi:hypothetical protein